MIGCENHCALGKWRNVQFMSSECQTKQTGSARAVEYPPVTRLKTKQASVDGEKKLIKCAHKDKGCIVRGEESHKDESKGTQRP